MKWLDRLKQKMSKPPAEAPQHEPECKTSNAIPLISAIDVHEQEPEPEVACTTLDSEGDTETPEEPVEPTIAMLTARERDVFYLLLEGEKIKDIGLSLGIKASTVNGYCKEIYKKLGVNSKMEIVLHYSRLRRQKQKGSETKTKGDE